MKTNEFKKELELKLKSCGLSQFKVDICEHFDHTLELGLLTDLSKIGPNENYHNYLNRIVEGITENILTSDLIRDTLDEKDKEIKELKKTVQKLSSEEKNDYYL